MNWKQSFYDCNVDIITLNETRLELLVDDKEVAIPGYKIYRRDRKWWGRGNLC